MNSIKPSRLLSGGTAVLPALAIAAVILFATDLWSQRAPAAAAATVPEVTSVIAAGDRFTFKSVSQTRGQRPTILRFDGATGDIAVLNTERGVWIRVELPLVPPQNAQENRAHIRLINDVVFD